MNILYKHEDIKKVCLESREAKRLYDATIVRQLQKRLYQLTAFRSLADVGTLFHLHELSGNRDGQLAVNLTGKYRLIFEPANQPLPKKKDGGLDRTRVTEITIIEVVNYHG